MSVTAAQVHRVAHLARLHIDEQNIPQYVDNLNKLLGLIDQMNAIDTQGIMAMAHPLNEQTQYLREDKAVSIEPQLLEACQQIAPSTEANLYLVPKVIE